MDDDGEFTGDTTSTFKKTGKGDVQRVFATVMSASLEFIKEYGPTAVYFSADKGEKSRVKLYNTMTKWLGKKLKSSGYVIDTDGRIESMIGDDSFVGFGLYHKEAMEDLEDMGIF